MTILKGRHYDNDFTNDFMLVNDAEKGLTLIDRGLRTVEARTLYKIGFVFTDNMREIIGHENAKWVNKKLADLHSVEELTDLIKELANDISGVAFGMFDEKNNRYIVIKDKKLYIETLKDEPEFNEYKIENWLLELTKIFSDYLGI